LLCFLHTRELSELLTTLHSKRYFLGSQKVELLVKEASKSIRAVTEQCSALQQRQRTLVMEEIERKATASRALFEQQSKKLSEMAEAFSEQLRLQNEQAKETWKEITTAQEKLQDLMKEQSDELQAVQSHEMNLQMEKLKEGIKLILKDDQNIKAMISN
jgi:predicted phage tail protein